MPRSPVCRRPRRWARSRSGSTADRPRRSRGRWPTGPIGRSGSGPWRWSSCWPMWPSRCACSATATSRGAPTGVVTFGVDVDPSTIADFEFLQAGHHADQRRVADGELRSELVTLLRDADVRGDGQPILVGFDGGDRARRDVPHPTRGGRVDRRGRRGLPRRCRARAGRAARAPRDRDRRGARRRRRAAKLDRWATAVGRAQRARVDAPYQVGWCSWYHYFDEITEDDAALEPGPQRRLALRGVPARRRLPVGDR